MKSTVFMFLLFLSAFGAFAQKEPNELCGKRQCILRSGTISLNSGIDQISGLLLDPGALDNNWTLTGVPVNSGIQIPAPTWVLPPYPSWDVFPGTQWVSPFTTSNFTVNNPVPSNPYTFQRCFCLCQADRVEIIMELMADDEALIFIDGIRIGRKVDNNVVQFKYPGRIVADTALNLSAGKHCLEVRLRNLNGTAMGFASIGRLTAVNKTILTNKCCSEGGRICGAVFKDGTRDCEGNLNYQFNSSLPNWRVRLVNINGNVIASTLTDDWGNYCFTGLPEGSYFVQQDLPFGWIQSFPLTNQPIVVTNGSLNTYSIINCSNRGKICGKKYHDTNCDGFINGDLDPPLPNWTINLFNQNGVLVAQTLTDANGAYCFERLPLGNQFVVTETNQPDWVQSYPTSGSYNVTTVFGDATSYDFANCYVVDPCRGELDVLYEQTGCKVFFSEPTLIPNPLSLPIVSIQWDFGDGNFSDDLAPSHVYSNPGVYVVCVKVTYQANEVTCFKDMCFEVIIPADCSIGIDGTSIDKTSNTATDQANVSVKVVPNPVIDEAEIMYTLPSNIPTAKIQLFDPQGTLVSSHVVGTKARTGKIKITHTLLKKGLYSYIVLVGDKVVLSGKVMKQ